VTQVATFSSTSGQQVLKADQNARLKSLHRDIWSSIAPLNEQMGTMWRIMALRDDPIQQ
jgi:hypothetical protein